MHIELELYFIAVLFGYLLLYRPVRHGFLIWNEYRLVYPVGLSLARAGAEGGGILVATLIGLGIAAAMYPIRGGPTFAGAMAVLLLGLLLSEIIIASALRIRSSTLELKMMRQPLLFRNRILDQLFRQAVCSKLGEKPTAIAELEAVARDPVKRAAMLTEYVESADRNGWVKLDRKIAKQHEGYYWHPPVLALLLLGLLFDHLHITIAHLNSKNFIETAELVRRSAALAFGAAFYPLAFLRDYQLLRETIQLAPMVMVLLFCFANPIARYALTLLLVVYFGISIAGLPEAVAQWNAHPAVKQWTSFVAVMGTPILGTIGKTVAGIASNGMTDVAIGMHRFWSSVSPSAWLGVSIVLWAPFVVKLVRHVWVSEIGNLYFASRVRRPVSCGAPAQSAIPSGFVVGVLHEKLNWKLTAEQLAQLKAAATISVGPTPVAIEQPATEAPKLPATVTAA